MLLALGATIPQYAHLSMILGPDGQKLSKRHGAVSVMQYHDDGYLPEAVLNYLARLGWSHGDEEVFTMQQFCEWFDLDHVTPSAAQFNTEKLNWLNAHYIKEANLDDLAKDITARLVRLDATPRAVPKINDVLSLYRERANNLNTLASDIAYFYRVPQINTADAEKHITPDILPAIKMLSENLGKIEWTAEVIHEALNSVVTEFSLKFPKIAMPLRVMLTGIAQSPSIDQVMALLGKQETLNRIQTYLK
jgi:glutamyl-tRNA synthetase